MIIEPQNSIGEVVARRTPYSKTFDMGGGNFKLIRSYIKEHYVDENDDLKTIDLNVIEKTEQGNHIGTIDKADFTLKVFDDVRIEYTLKKDGILRGAKLTKTGDTDVVGNIPFVVTTQGHTTKIAWDNVTSNIDIYILVRPNGIEFFKVLKDSGATKTFEWEIDGEIAGLDKQVFGFDSNNREIKISHDVVDIGQGKSLLTETFEGEVAYIPDPKTRIKEWRTEVQYPVIIDVPDFTEDISAEIDDVHSGAGFVTTGAVRVGYDLSASVSFKGGFRFRTLPIPIGSTIVLAELKVQVNSITGTPNIKVYIDVVADAYSWSDSAGDRVQDITKSTAFGAFSPTSTGLKTINITDALAEVVVLGGWASNNNVRFGMFTSAGPNEFLYIDGYSQTTPATLEVDYSTGGVDIFKGGPKTGIQLITP